MNERMESPEIRVESAENVESPGFLAVSDPEIGAAGAPQATLEGSTSTPLARAARRGNADDWMNGIQWLSSTIVLAVFVITFLAQAFQIPSESMEKTLLIGDYLLVDKVHYGQGGVWKWLMPYSEISRGDIVVFRYPVHPSQHFVKRVIGIPGDHVHLYRGKVFVNGSVVDDSRACGRGVEPTGCRGKRAIRRWPGRKRQRRYSADPLPGSTPGQREVPGCRGQFERGGCHYPGDQSACHGAGRLLRQRSHLNDGAASRAGQEWGGVLLLAQRLWGRWSWRRPERADHLDHAA